MKSERSTPCSISSVVSKASSDSAPKPYITFRSRWGRGGWRRRMVGCRSPRQPRRSCSKGWRSRAGRDLWAGAPPDRWRMVGSGWGAGQRDPKHYPNALRILIAEVAAEAGRVVVLATDVDDMSPEYVEPLRQALVQAGALDVQTWPVQMKKGRQGFRVEVMAPEALAEAVTAELFRHSTTAGVRRWTAERATLPRHQLTVRLDGVAVRVKVLDGGQPRVKPEYDDVLAAAQALGRPPLEVARAVERDAEALIAKSKE